MAQDHDRYVHYYPMRFAAASFMILITVLYVHQFGSFTVGHWALVLGLLLYPHVIRLLEHQSAGSRAKIEYGAVLIDAFLLGVVVHLTSFALLPTLTLCTVALASALAANGHRHMFHAALALVAGMALTMPFVGVDYAPRQSVVLDLACSGFLFFYFNFFAFSAHRRSQLLTRSRSELRDQKATLEIQKVRSDQLILNLVPGSLAEEFSRTGRLEVREFDPVTLLAIDFPGFHETVKELDSREVIAHLVHCFKACDSITARFRLVALKTIGDLYLAVAGLPEPAPGDADAAVGAACAVNDYLLDLNASRRAQRRFVLVPRVRVHTGTIHGGTVETAKLSYDVWGEAVDTLLTPRFPDLTETVMLTEPTRRLLRSNGHPVQPAWPIKLGVGRELRLYTLEQSRG